MTIQSLSIDQIVDDSNLQTRYFGVNGSVASEYEDRMKEGVEFPPITVFFDGEQYHLADGFHRLSAARHIGLKEIKADVLDGTRRDAEFYAMTEANRDHGLRLSQEDKRKRVARLLQDETWTKMSNREIARQTGTSHTFVAMMRDSINPKPLGAAEIKANQQAQAFRESVERIGNVAIRTPQTFTIGDRVLCIPRGVYGVIREIADNDPINAKRYPGTALVYFGVEDGGHGTSHRYALEQLAQAKAQPVIVEHYSEALGESLAQFVQGESVTTRSGHSGRVVEQSGQLVKVLEDSGATRTHYAVELKLHEDDDEPDDQEIIDQLQDGLMETFQSERVHLIIPTLSTVLCAADGCVQMSSSDMNTQIDMLINMLSPLKT